MSTDLPESIDAWRAVAARRIYAGQVALSRFDRLTASLADSEGSCRFKLSFEQDSFGTATVAIEADAELPLTCQRTLERFLFPVKIRQLLGLVRNEREEAALRSDVEPVLVPGDGELKPLELVEDELILALPVVPLSPGSKEVNIESGESDAAEEPRNNPFAALAALKKQSS